MAKAQARKKKGSGSSRRNYQASEEASGWHRYRPTGWANWLGFALFGIIFVALAVETVQAAVEGRGADPVAALVMTAGFGWMVYLFATTRVKDV